MLFRLTKSLSAALLIFAVSPQVQAQSSYPLCKGLSAATIEDVKAKGGKLPDLRTERATYFWIQSTTSGRALRFGNGISNHGEGPFEVTPINVAGTTYGVQRIYDRREASEAGAKVVFECQGSAYEFHPTHGHWHLEAMSRYRLYRTDGTYTGLGSSKVSFCLIDYTKLTTSAAAKYYTECNSDAQGISVGWNDYYRSTLPGQSIDISNLADGQYWFLSNSAPIKSFLEARTDNNHTWTLLDIVGTRVKVVRTWSPR